MGENSGAAGRHHQRGLSSSAKTPWRARTIIGSSGYSGKRGPDLQEEVVVVAVAVCHPLHHFDAVVDALQEAGVQRPLAVSNDAVDTGLQPPGKAFERLYSASHGTVVPVFPEPQGGASVAIGPEMLEVVFQ